MSSTQAATASLPLPSEQVLNLAKADLVFAVIFLFLSGYVAWRHGKAGLVCWPIFVHTFIARLIADVFQIIKKDEPLQYNTVTKITGAAVTACVSLTLIGAVYLCNTMLPSKNKNRNQKILLAATHLVNTAGIGMVTYAGAPSDTAEGGVVNQMLNRIGSLLLISVLAMIYAWLWPTWRKIKRFSRTHPNAGPARWLLIATMAALPFWLVRLAWVVTYAFAHGISSLDPVTGSFGTKLVLLFGTYLLASGALLVGGWFGVRTIEPGTPEEHLHLVGEEYAMNGGDSNRIETLGQSRLK